MNLPASFTEYTRALLGVEEYEKLVSALQQEPPVSIRLNRLKVHRLKVVAIARDKSGKEVARHHIETAGKAVALRIEAETPADWKADGMDLQYINVTAIDKKGRPMWDYNKPLTLQMEGAAWLVALDNGDHYTDELFHGITSKRMYQGRMQIILRSTKTPSNVKLEISPAH